MLIKKRSFEPADGSYRYGFQGQERDDELKGEGNSLNYTFRMHDPRVGRFFTVDPLASKYPYYTPYSFSGNKPIQFVELEGLEEADPNGDGMMAGIAIQFYDGVRNTIFQPLTRALKDDEAEGKTIREALTALGYDKNLFKNISNEKLGKSFKLKSVGTYYDVFPKEDALGEAIDFGLSALDVVSIMPQKGQVSFAIKAGGLGVQPVVGILRDLAIKSGTLRIKKLNGQVIEGVATAIGRMDELKKYDNFANVDTWHKSGRIPGVGDKAVTWAENRKWLQERIDRGDTFIMTMNPKDLPTEYIKDAPNGYFTKLEYDYLVKKGANIIHDYKGAPKQ